MRPAPAAVLAGGTLALVATHRRLLRLGATAAEAGLPLPGDDLVARPDVDSTMAIDIAAPPSAVWPWLAQMGGGRGGWYGIDLLDNGGRPSATTIQPAWQAIGEGDRIPLTPRGRACFTVEAVAPAGHLVLGWRGRLAGIPVASSWALVLEEREGGCRLLARARAGAARHRLAFRALALLAAGPGHVAVQCVQLVRVRRRAEGRHRLSPPGRGCARRVPDR